MKRASVSWANYARKLRTGLALTRREFAKAIHVDPSYITLWERDGRQPRRPIVERLAIEFGQPLEEALVAAGYPRPLSRKHAPSLDKFESALYRVVMRLQDLKPKHQRDVARLLNVFIDSLGPEAEIAS